MDSPLSSVTVASTQRPGSDTIPTSIRDIFSYWLALNSGTPQMSDMILGQGNAARGADASQLPDCPGLGYLLAEGGEPRLMRCYYLDDERIRRHVAPARVARAGAKASCSSAR